VRITAGSGTDGSPLFVTTHGVEARSTARWQRSGGAWSAENDRNVE
jgi:hypothetical protein